MSDVLARLQKLVIASGNAGKIAEFRDYFTYLGINLIPKPDHIDVEETGLTFIANAHLKASQVAIATNEWAIADDSGLEIDALNGAPGVFSGRYAKTDQARIDRVLQELGDTLNRQARYVCAIAIASPDGEIFADAIGTCEGAIALAPVGESGFGYDPIFFASELQKTFGEVSLEAKAKISHRAKALLLLQSKLKTLL